jgi:excisionase family DNA binding protein
MKALLTRGGDRMDETRIEGNDSRTAALPPILTPEDLAILLRMRRRAVLDAIGRGELPGVRRVGRKIRADRDTILRWIAEGRGALCDKAGER